jgi:hypothetical protein
MHRLRVHNVNVTKREGYLLTLRTYAVLNVDRGLAGAIVLTKCTGNPAHPPSMPQLMFYARRSIARREAG